MEQLKEYLEKLESADMTAAFCIDGEEEAEVRGVTFDSKEVVSRRDLCMQREKLPGGVFKGGPGAGLYLLCEREAVRAFGRDRLDSGERYPEGHAGAGGHFLPDGAGCRFISPASREPRERRPLPIILR